MIFCCRWVIGLGGCSHFNAKRDSGYWNLWLDKFNYRLIILQQFFFRAAVKTLSCPPPHLHAKTLTGSDLSPAESAWPLPCSYGAHMPGGRRGLGLVHIGGIGLTVGNEMWAITLQLLIRFAAPGSSTRGHQVEPSAVMNWSIGAAQEEILLRLSIYYSFY